MINLRSFSFAGCLLVVVLALQPMLLHAQRSTTLLIRDGQIRVNNRVIPPGELPASLDIEGVDAQFSFAGTASPIIQLGDHVYQFDAQGLREVNTAKQDGVRVFFRSSASAQPPVLQRYRQEQPFTVYLAADSTGERALAGQYAALMQEQALRLSQISEQVSARDGIAYEDLAQDLRLRAEQAALVAEELPQLEIKSYLADVEQRDHRLYQRLINEQRMENETRRLAAQIRSMRPGSDRDALVEQLEGLLDKIFELKQENRRDEIVQLESQLQELNRLLREREAMRARIIARRMQVLVGAATNN